MTYRIDPRPLAPPEIAAQSILLNDLFRIAEAPCWIAGGMLRDLMSGDPWKDIDFFFPTREARLHAHLVKYYAPNPIAMLETFDFIACAAAITRDGFVHHPAFIEDVRDRRLSLLGEPRNRSYARALRLRALGWTISQSDWEALERAAVLGTEYPSEGPLDSEDPPAIAPCWLCASLPARLDCIVCSGSRVDARPASVNLSRLHQLQEL